MSRMTRSRAAGVAESLHIDGDVVLELQSENRLPLVKEDTPEPHDRAPLGELAPNSGDNKAQSHDVDQSLKSSTRGRKGGKTGQRKKTNLAASTTASPGDTQHDHQEILRDESDSVPSPASEQAAEDLMHDMSHLDTSRGNLNDTRQDQAQVLADPVSSNTRRTILESETGTGTLVQSISQTPQGLETTTPVKQRTNGNALEISTMQFSGDASNSQLPMQVMHAPTSPLPTAMPNVIKHLRGDTPGKRSTSNKENVEPQNLASNPPTPYDTLEGDVATSSTLLAAATTRQDSIIREDSIAALDAMNEAVEDDNKSILDVQTTPAKPQSNMASSMRKESKKVAPTVRTTKASQARLSMAQSQDRSSRAPAWGRPRPSNALGRSSSVRQAGAAKAEPTGGRVASARQARNATAGTTEDRKETIIPHSKPRPVSLSFPTPPPVAKSSKAPTQSTFQLPGEAVAAKLKAAREARVKREAEEEEKKKVFKARPVPASLSKAPSVRQTNSSRARESIMNGKDMRASTSITASIASHKRSDTVPNISRAPVPKPRNVSKEVSAPATHDLTVKKRPSTALAGTSKPRSALIASAPRPSTGSTTQRAPSNPTKGTAKGKEVFNRPAAAKAAAEKEKLEKEAAAKKARADAAERGRVASREWADKQKLRKHGAAKTGVKGGEQTVDGQPAAGNETTLVEMRTTGIEIMESTGASNIAAS